MFPTLFPYGLGGFDDNTREVAISFQKHVQYLLDIADRFGYHRSFLFVTSNIHQRQTAHLHTWRSVKKSWFDRIAPKLAKISAERLQRVATHIEKNGKIVEMSSEDREVMTMGYFGLPQHSPIFHAMWGDDGVNLVAQFPDMVDSVQRGQRIASNPVTGADFFIGTHKVCSAEQMHIKPCAMHEHTITRWTKQHIKHMHNHGFMVQSHEQKHPCEKAVKARGGEGVCKGDPVTHAWSRFYRVDQA